MNKQRQILVTVTYNELGCIIDTKAQPYEEPNLQPTCNQFATSCISRQVAIEAIQDAHHKTEVMSMFDNGKLSGLAKAANIIRNLPSAQPEIIRCKDCEYGEQDHEGDWFCRSYGFQIGGPDGSGFCSEAERRTE
jgi:hypothetical protein